MSTMPSTTLPSPAELENLGILFVGFVVSVVFYGLTFFQTYIYYSRYPKDLVWTKYLVATLSILDTAVSALVSQVLYYYLITLFDVSMDVLYATTTFCIQYMLSVLLTFISHLYFAHRVFQVTGGARLVTIALIFLSFITMVFGFVSSAQMFGQRRLSAFGSIEMEITTATGLFAGVVTDLIVVVTMCFSLRRVRYPELALPEGPFTTFAAVLVGRGLAFTVFQIAYFCVFVAKPSRQFWIPLQMITCKIYVNTVLGHLNSREVKHGIGLNEEESLSERRVPTNRRLQSSIRFNVTDHKATVQTVNLTTRQTDTESDGTELESRKTYQDDHRNEYSHVSTESTTSQKSELGEHAALSLTSA